MILAVTGSRHWTDRESIFAVLDYLRDEREVTELIHGGAEGVDTMAKEWAESRGVPARAIRPDYKTWPWKVAPLKRNEDLVRQADGVVGFRAEGVSRGTDYTIGLARKSGKLILKVTPTGMAIPFQFTTTIDPAKFRIGPVACSECGNLVEGLMAAPEIAKDMRVPCRGCAARKAG